MTRIGRGMFFIMIALVAMMGLFTYRTISMHQEWTGCARGAMQARADKAARVLAEALENHDKKAIAEYVAEHKEHYYHCFIFEHNSDPEDQYTMVDVPGFHGFADVGDYRIQFTANGIMMFFGFLGYWLLEGLAFLFGIVGLIMVWRASKHCTEKVLS